MKFELENDSLAYGQIVIVTARWILVAVGLLLTLWNPAELPELRLQIMVLLLMSVANFYLHVQALTKKPTLPTVIYGASAFDMLAVTLFIASSGSGFDSALYTFYFPAILAFSVVFPIYMTVAYTSLTGVLYTFVTVVNTSYTLADTDLPILLTRLLMLVAVAFCGNLYLRVEEKRRQMAIEDVSEQS